MEIKSATVHTIEKLKGSFFVIPDYQREYVWKRDKNIQKLMDDINEEFDGSSEKNYFIGNVLLVKNKQGIYDVIDGQQRLTTIVIFLCAFRDHLEKMKNIENDKDLEEVANEILVKIKDLIYDYSISRREKTSRLTLKYEEARDFLKLLVEKKEYKGEMTESIKRMRDAYEVATDFITKQVDSIKFMEYFLTRVEMVIIEAGDVSSALKIFETINQRGVGLDAMDLLKNLIFMESKEEDFKTIKEIWKRMNENLEKCGEGDKPLRFLRYFLMAKYVDGVITEDEIYDWITSTQGKAKINYKKKPIDFANELLSSSAKYSQYVQMTESDFENQKYPSITRIGYLGRMNFRQHIILLLATDKLDEKSRELLAKQMETLIFYYVVTSESTKDFEKKFSKWAKDLREIETSVDLVKFIEKYFLTEIKRLDIKFNEMFLNITQDDINPLYRTKYILGRIENYIREKCGLPLQGLDFFQDKMELEHILPQTPESIPNDQFIDENEYRNYVFRLGNLTLVEGVINKALNKVNKISNPDWFNGKLNEYKKSDMVITKTISEIRTVGKNTALNQFLTANIVPYTKWNKDEIKDRQERLLKFVKDIWKIQVSDE